MDERMERWMGAYLLEELMDTKFMNGLIFFVRSLDLILSK